MHEHCVCSGSEPEYTSGQKDFILGGQVSSFLQVEDRKFLKQLGGEQMFFNICFQLQEPPLVVINDTFLSANDSKTKYSKCPSVEITDTKHKIKLKMH